MVARDEKGYTISEETTKVKIQVWEDQKRLQHDYNMIANDHISY